MRFLQDFVRQETLFYQGRRESLQTILTHQRRLLREGVKEGQNPNRVLFMEETHTTAVLAEVDRILGFLGKLTEDNQARMYETLCTRHEVGRGALNKALKELETRYAEGTDFRDPPEAKWLQYAGSLDILGKFEESFHKFRESQG